MAAVMGERVGAGTYSSNVSLPGCGEQLLHVDQSPRQAEDEVGGPCVSMVMNIPLSDFTLANGATEMWPGTHRVPCEIGSRHPTQAQQAERIAAGAPPERAIMKRGAILLRDIRLWHRGPANRTDVYRPMLSMICQGGLDPAGPWREQLAHTGTFPAAALATIEQRLMLFNFTFDDPARLATP